MWLASESLQPQEIIFNYYYCCFSRPIKKAIINNQARDRVWLLIGTCRWACRQLVLGSYVGIILLVNVIPKCLRHSSIGSKVKDQGNLTSVRGSPYWELRLLLDWSNEVKSHRPSDQTFNCFEPIINSMPMNFFQLSRWDPGPDLWGTLFVLRSSYPADSTW